jgi:hypothetical protein
MDDGAFASGIGDYIRKRTRFCFATILIYRLELFSSGFKM